MILLLVVCRFFVEILNGFYLLEHDNHSFLQVQHLSSLDPLCLFLSPVFSSAFGTCCLAISTCLVVLYSVPVIVHLQLFVNDSGLI